MGSIPSSGSELRSWCDGNIGMHGPSYVGNVQWQAAAMGSRYLKTIVPRVIGDNLHESPQYQGGAFQLGWTALWSFFMDGRSGQSIDIYDWTQVFHTLPIRELPELSGKDIAFYREWCDHPDYDEYWKSLAIKERYGDIGIPVMQIGGWYDFFTAGTFINFAGMTERGGTDLARENQRTIVGPWVHQAGRLTYAGDKDFGFDSTQDLLEMELAWFDRWLRSMEQWCRPGAAPKALRHGRKCMEERARVAAVRVPNSPLGIFTRGGAANFRNGRWRPVCASARRRAHRQLLRTTPCSQCLPGAGATAATLRSLSGVRTISAKLRLARMCLSIRRSRWRPTWK